MSETKTSTLDIPTRSGAVPVTLSDRGAGSPILLLHGGGGPATVEAFAELVAGERPVRVITPIHPGFGGTPRPDSLTTVGGLAELYRSLLEQLHLEGVTVVGNSIGGWIAAEMAIRSAATRFVLVDAVGIVVAGHPVVDFFSLTPRQVAEHSYHDPDRFGIDPARLPEPARLAMAANRATLTVYAGTEMADPTLRERLGSVTAPVLVVWGEDDRIADPDYGRALAGSIPGARFLLLSESGHLPQLEAPARLLEAVWDFTAAAGPRTPHAAS